MLLARATEGISRAQWYFLLISPSDLLDYLNAVFLLGDGVLCVCVCLFIIFGDGDKYLVIQHYSNECLIGRCNFATHYE